MAWRGVIFSFMCVGSEDRRGRSLWKGAGWPKCSSVFSPIPTRLKLGPEARAAILPRARPHSSPLRSTPEHYQRGQGGSQPSFFCRWGCGSQGLLGLRLPRVCMQACPMEGVYGDEEAFLFAAHGCIGQETVGGKRNITRK